METLLQDLRYGARMLAKRPGFTLIAVITLALGIGANTAIFSVVNAVLLKPLPYPEPDRLVAVRESHIQNQPDSQVAPGNFIQWQQQSTLFSHFAAYRTVPYNLTGEGGPERIRAGRVSAGFFAALGVSPILGRDFLEEEDQPGREKVAIISHGLWQRRFAGDDNTIGKTLRLSGESYTVVGVLPAGFQLPDAEREVWTPIAFNKNERELRHAHYVEAVARLRPGVAIDQAEAELNAIAGQLAEQYPDSNSGWGVRLTPLIDFAVGDAAAALWVLVGAVGFVLMIACVNVANLMLARAATRQKEMAIRTALGAGRRRIVRQLLTESLLLAVLGGSAGLLLAGWGIAMLQAIAPQNIPRLAEAAIDKRVLLFTIAVTLLTGLIFGLVPALQLSKVELSEALKEASKGVSRGARRQRIGRLLVISEVAMAMVLLVGGGLLMRSFWLLRQVDPGFDYTNGLAVTIQLSEKKYTEDQRINLFSRQLIEHVRTLPGVESAAVARIMPIVHDMPIGFYVEGRPREKDNQLPQTGYSAVSPDYFKAMGIPLIRGRAFTDQDTQGAQRVAIISETMAKRYFADEDPIGKQINVATTSERFREIVGIVGDVKQKGLNRETLPQTYEPFAQAPNQFMTLVVRTSTDQTALVNAIRGKVLEIDGEQPLHSVRTLEAMVSNSIRQPRFLALLLSSFAATALLLAAVGLYAVVSSSVAERTHEIGIRMALGAGKRDVLKLVIGQEMKNLFVGVAIGLVGALMLSRLLTNLLFGVSAVDPLTLVAVSLILMAVALAACYLPARHATGVDPTVALRHE